MKQTLWVLMLIDETVYEGDDIPRKVKLERGHNIKSFIPYTWGTRRLDAQTPFFEEFKHEEAKITATYRQVDSPAAKIVIHYAAIVEVEVDTNDAFDELGILQCDKVKIVHIYMRQRLPSKFKVDFKPGVYIRLGQKTKTFQQYLPDLIAF